MSDKVYSIILICTTLVMVGCSSLLGGDPTAEAEPTSAEETAAEGIEPTPTDTPIPIAPTLGGDGQPGAPPTLTPSGDTTTESAGPTALPDPTEVTVATDDPPQETSEDDDPAPAVPQTGPGVSIDPQLSEPGTTISVDGDGFEPGQSVPIGWGLSPTEFGVQVDTVQADEDGSFEIRVDVPPASQWPGGAEEGEAIYLQAIDEVDNIIYWAEFKYIALFNPQTPVLNFDNPDEGYSVTVYNAWAWDWVEEETDNVRFQNPSGIEQGFIRAYNSSDMDGVIQTVMNVEFPGEEYSTGAASAGRYAGVQAQTVDGDNVFFYEVGGQIYAVWFVNNDGSTAFSIIDTFSLLQQ